VSLLEITKVDADSPAIVQNLQIKIDGVVIQHVESLELWVGQGGVARAAVTFDPTNIKIHQDVLLRLKGFIDKAIQDEEDKPKELPENGTDV
jgi:hypothetical protein